MIFRKFLSLFLLCAIVLSLSSCSHAVVSFVEIPEYSSDVYSDEDIEAAINIVKQNIAEIEDRWTLLELSYIGDEWLDSYQDWADRNDADEVIVILSDFYISYFSDNPTMGAGQKYEDFNWILVRNEGEEWRIVDRGY
ncbi:MAG: hypothetical protein IJD70_01690 [Clostridia bacterium]|nr:hypothetical protein [Clostridia bacterium]